MAKTDLPEGLPKGTIVFAPDHYLCPRCKCCDLVFEDCETCGGEGQVEGTDWEEDFLLEPEMEACEICQGMGGWWACLGRCDEHGKHAPKPRKPKPDKFDPRDVAILGGDPSL